MGGCQNIGPFCVSSPLLRYFTTHWLPVFSPALSFKSHATAFSNRACKSRVSLSKYGKSDQNVTSVLSFAQNVHVRERKSPQVLIGQKIREQHFVLYAIHYYTRCLQQPLVTRSACFVRRRNVLRGNVFKNWQFEFRALTPNLTRESCGSTSKICSVTSPFNWWWRFSIAFFHMATLESERWKSCMWQGTCVTFRVFN